MDGKHTAGLPALQLAVDHGNMLKGYVTDLCAACFIPDLHGIAALGIPKHAIPRQDIPRVFTAHRIVISVSFHHDTIVVGTDKAPFDQHILAAHHINAISAHFQGDNVHIPHRHLPAGRWHYVPARAVYQRYPANLHVLAGQEPHHQPPGSRFRFMQQAAHQQPIAGDRDPFRVIGTEASMYDRARFQIHGIAACQFHICR